MRGWITLGLLGVATISHAAGFKLDWTDNSNNEANFIIERATGACSVARAAPTWSQIGSTPPDVKTYTDTTTTAGQIYCYRVGARNTAGTNYSELAQAGSPPPLAPPVAPSALGVTVLP